MINHKRFVIVIFLSFILFFITGCKNLFLLASDESVNLSTVTYHSNGATGGTVPLDTTGYKAGSSVIAMANTGTLAKTGLTFTGWNTSPDGSGITIGAGAAFKMGVNDVILYALWHYSITYMSTGNPIGSPPATQYANYNTTVIISGNSGNLAGDIIVPSIRQRFLGWSTDPGAPAPDSTYAPGSTSPLITANLTLYAIYTTDGDVLRKIGPAGGLIFYNKGSFTDGWQYMEATPVAYESSGIWQSPHYFINADGLVVGQGSSNTQKIRDWVEGGAGRIAPVAEHCYNLSYIHNGITYDDWFMPSTSELQAMYDNLHVFGVGGFTNYLYYSSTETALDHMHEINFGVSRNLIGGNKSDQPAKRVRPARRF